MAPVCTAPEAQDNRWTLTFDPVTTVKGDLAIDLGLVWLDDDEESPRHCAVELPLGPWVLESREGALVGTRSKRWPGSVRGKRERDSQRATYHLLWPVQPIEPVPQAVTLHL